MRVMRYRSGRPGLLLASALAAAVAALLLGVHVRRAIPLVHTAAPPAAGVSLLLVGPTPALPALGAPQSGAPQGAVCPATPATRATATPPQVSQAPPQAQAAEVVGQVGGTLSALAVRGDTAYAVLGSRLAVLDVSVSGAPVATNGPRLLGQSAPLSHP